MRTFLLRNEDVEREWFVVDATDQTLGKLAARVARVLMGKDDPRWTPSTDSGNFVVVVNAEKVHVTGKKRTDKVYRYYTGYVGGLVEHTFAELQARKPERIIELAVRRMLPKTRQGRAQFKRLRVYAGPEHQHQAQQPKPLAIA
ncbi:MAG TPA: 50S ribosomal protein L13 [Planctomycetota bacterium]|nr:50S ribosomal protein L13 [Planctomycetota bacterium]